MVADQIVCIDDLDRRGANLRIEDVLGLIPSFDTVPAWPFEFNLGDKKLEDLYIKLASAETNTNRRRRDVLACGKRGEDSSAGLQ